MVRGRRHRVSCRHGTADAAPGEDGRELAAIEWHFGRDVHLRTLSDLQALLTKLNEALRTRRPSDGRGYSARARRKVSSSPLVTRPPRLGRMWA